MPPFLHADYSKIDMPKLKSDMEKWYSLMPETAKEWWRMFFDSIDVSEENHSRRQNS